jgi:uncharacterized membrane protein YccC
MEHEALTLMRESAKLWRETAKRTQRENLNLRADIRRLQGELAEARRETVYLRIFPECEREEDAFP